METRFTTNGIFPRRAGSCFVVLCVGVLLLAWTVSSVAQTSRKTGPAKAPATPAAQRGEPKFKAIWEPVNVKDDLQLMSVHFATADDGWAAGGRTAVAGGMILHTKARVLPGKYSWETRSRATAPTTISVSSPGQERDPRLSTNRLRWVEGGACIS